MDFEKDNEGQILNFRNFKIEGSKMHDHAFDFKLLQLNELNFEKGIIFKNNQAGFALKKYQNFFTQLEVNR